MFDPFGVGYFSANQIFYKHLTPSESRFRFVIATPIPKGLNVYRKDFMIFTPTPKGSYVGPLKPMYF